MAYNEQYLLGHSAVEQRRLQQQAGELAEEAAERFDQIELAQGSRVVEIGCGPQGCLELLSSRVGPAGSVVGVELSQHTVQLAREFLWERRISNVEVRRGHAADTGLPRKYFDLVTARLVLVNIPEPVTFAQLKISRFRAWEGASSLAGQHSGGPGEVF